MTEDTPVLDTVIEMTAVSVSHSSLNDRELMLVRTAALAASHASVGSYMLNLSADVDAGLTLEDAQGVLTAVAPIIGTTRTMSAATAMAGAFGLALAIEDAIDQEEDSV
jgi:hypothetical protein